MTNDGNAILREIDVSHPAAKNLIELSRAQDEEVGDGTTSVIVLAAEMLSVFEMCGNATFIAIVFLQVAEPLLDKNIHPTLIVRGYLQALESVLKLLDDVAIPINATDPKELSKVYTQTRFSIDLSLYPTQLMWFRVLSTQSLFRAGDQ